MFVRSLVLENFKSYNKCQMIPIRKLSLFMGANSSGKTSAIQALLVLKQTLESSSPDIDLLLSGKYANIGDFRDALNINSDSISIGLVTGDNDAEIDGNSFSWTFKSVDEQKSEALLDKVNLSIPEGMLEIRRVVGSEHAFRFSINDTPTQYFAKIINLNITGLELGYNSGLNLLFYEYLAELSHIIFPEKETFSPEMHKDKFVPLYALQAFEDAVLSNLTGNRPKDNDNNFLLSLVDSFCTALSEDSYSGYWIRGSLRKYCWNSIIEKNNNVLLRNIYDKYKVKLEAYCSKGVHRSELDKTVPIEPFYRPVSANNINQYDIIKLALSNYSYLVDLLKKKVTYLGPLRERPQGLYNNGFESVPKYVGPSGAFFASVLLHEDKERSFILPHNVEETVTLSEACASWLDYLGVATDVRAEKQGAFGVRVAVSNLVNQESDILNVGIGTSQVLPVLLCGLLSGHGDLLVFEQPELHLHPLSQSRLADFFSMLSNHGRRVIVETHSESLLMRLRYLVLDNSISKNDVAVVFFQNEDGTIIREAALDEYGGINYPEDFRDTNEKLIEALLRKSLAKRSVDG